MSAPGREPGMRRMLEERIVWPLLDFRDWVLRRNVEKPVKPKPMYEVHHETRRQRFVWAALDAKDAALAPLKRRMHRLRLRYDHSPLRKVNPRAALVAIPVALLTGLGIATFVGDDTGSDGSVRASAKVPAKAAAAPAPRVEVAGVSESADERRARRAERRREQIADKRADRRRAARRKNAAERRRAVARRKARKKKRSSSSSAPATPVSAPSTQSPSSGSQGSGGGSSSAPQQSAPAPPRSSPPRAPSGGGGGGGGGNSSPPKPQPSPGVAFDDSG